MEVHRQRLGTVVSDVLKGCAVLLLVPSRPGYYRETRNMQVAIQIHDKPRLVAHLCCRPLRQFIAISACSLGQAQLASPGMSCTSPLPCPGCISLSKKRP